MILHITGCGCYKSHETYIKTTITRDKKRMCGWVGGARDVIGHAPTADAPRPITRQSVPQVTYHRFRPGK